jgi:3-oxoacyl-[acyl-carrier protein] reductase
MSLTHQNNSPLKGKVAVVTGAGRGIGRAIAIGYAKAGAAVCCAARSKNEIEKTANEISNFGGKSISIRTDVTNEDDARRMLEETAKKLGGIDILVINAGITNKGGSVEDTDRKKWADVIETNLTGAYFTAKCAIPHLKKRGGGKIITIGSGVSRRGGKKTSAVSCSKAGLWMLTRILAKELWRDNISVNEIIPGPVITGFNPRGLPKSASEWIKRPEDVVPLALFLATQPSIGPTAQSYSLMRRENIPG